MMLDREPSEVPEEIISLLRSEGILGKNIGIYRMVSPQELSYQVRTGSLPGPVAQSHIDVDADTKVIVRSYDLSFAELLDRLTYGILGLINFHPPKPVDDFWVPKVIRGFGFTTANRRHKRWFNYLEILGHVEPAAWDPRSIWARVSVDVRRHFIHAIARNNQSGGSLSQDAPLAPLDLITDKLRVTLEAINGFAELLDSHGDDPESTFHDYLASHPVLLDVYGEVESKPRFEYPPGESPLGKQYVEPDFLIRYPGLRYRLVELERPKKGLATIQGQPRSEVTQAAFQIAEWMDFIQNHYDTLKERYPGISSRPWTLLVISRSTAKHSGVPNVERYLAMVRQQLAVDEVITYDGLLEKAREAYTRLSGAISDSTT
jgi:hypothetical protein